MSIINQVLQDLDVREASEKERAGLPQRLRVLPPTPVKKTPVLAILALGIGAGALIATLVVFFVLNPPPNLPPVAASPAAAPVVVAALQPAPATPPPPPVPAVESPPPPLPAIELPPVPLVREEPPPSPPPPPQQKSEAKPATPVKAAPPTPTPTSTQGPTPRPTPPPTQPAQESGQIEKRPPGGGTALSLAEEEYRKGIQAVRSGDAVIAQALFQRALDFDPGHAKARQALLSVLVGGRQWEEAKRIAEAGLALDPRQSGWATILARLHFEKGNSATAIDTLQRHAAHAAGDAEYQGLFAYLLQKEQRAAEAIERFKVALALRPGEGRWWFGLGVALQSEGRGSEARDAFTKARDAGNLPADMQAVVDQKIR